MRGLVLLLTLSLLLGGCAERSPAGPDAATVDGAAEATPRTAERASPDQGEAWTGSWDATSEGATCVQVATACAGAFTSSSGAQYAARPQDAKRVRVTLTWDAAATDQMRVRVAGDDGQSSEAEGTSPLVLETDWAADEMGFWGEAVWPDGPLVTQDPVDYHGEYAFLA